MVVLLLSIDSVTMFLSHLIQLLFYFIVTTLFSAATVKECAFLWRDSFETRVIYGIVVIVEK